MSMETYKDGFIEGGDAYAMGDEIPMIPLDTEYLRGFADGWEDAGRRDAEAAEMFGLVNP